MATPGTVNGNKFHDLLGHYSDKANVIPLGCPGLMEYVEKGDTDGPGVTAYLTALLTPHLEKTHVDAIVLGCTHYPFVAPLIRKIAGSDVRIFDGGEGTARELKRRLTQEHLLRKQAGHGSVRFENSLPEKIGLCRRLLYTEDGS